MAGVRSGLTGSERYRQFMVETLTVVESYSKHSREPGWKKVPLNRPTTSSEIILHPGQTEARGLAMAKSCGERGFLLRAGDVYKYILLTSAFYYFFRTIATYESLYSKGYSGLNKTKYH